MSNESINSEHVNDIYQDAILNLNRLAEIDYESEYARAMALKPYRDLINSFDTKFREGKIAGRMEEKIKGIMEGKMEAKLEVAKKLLLIGLEIEFVIKVTGLTRDVIKTL